MPRKVEKYLEGWVDALTPTAVRLLRFLTAVLSAGLIVGSMSLQPALATEHLSEVDRPVPQFDLVTVDADRWQADSLQGKPWIINFWATWCPPCIEELPSMNAAWEKLEERGVGMLAINAGEGQAAVETFLGKIPIDFTTLLGDAQSLGNWSVRALPTTIVVDASGKVVYEALGPREWDDDALLEKVLALVK